jgi:hypothetical protein
VLFDFAKDLVILGGSALAGSLSGATIAGGALALPGIVFTHWLSSPAKVSSMASWSRARVGYLNHPTPVRLGLFNVATRNLSHNIGVPVESIMHRLTVADPNGARDQDRQVK